MTISKFEDYEAHDVNNSQAHVLELIRRISAPVSGQTIVDILIAKRMLWFAVYPVVHSDAIPPMALSFDTFYSDGITVYTDVRGHAELIAALKPIKGISCASFTNVSKHAFEDAADLETEVVYSPESTVFVNIGWDLPPELQEKFTQSAI